MPLKEIIFYGEYKLRFDWMAFEQMTEAIGAPAFVDLERVMQKLGPKQIRLILWAGLLHQYPDLKQADVFPLINAYLETHSMEELSAVVIKALTEASILGGSDKGEVQKIAVQP